MSSTPPGAPTTPPDDKVAKELAILRVQIGYLITKVEVSTAQAEAVNDRMELRIQAAERLNAGQRSISDTLFKTAMALSTARAIHLMAPKPAQVLALAVGACVGCYAATMTWLALHPATHVAALLP